MFTTALMHQLRRHHGTFTHPHPEAKIDCKMFPVTLLYPKTLERLSSNKIRHSFKLNILVTQKIS